MKAEKKSTTETGRSLRRLRTSEDARESGKPSETALFSLKGLTEAPLKPVDVPYSLLVITQEELESYSNAERAHRVAEADFARKRGNLALRLLLGCEVESGYIRAKLDKDGRIVLKETDPESSGQTTRS